MARWPDLLAAAALLASPAALSAQQRDRLPEVDPARVIAAADTCRETPSDFDSATRHARSLGWSDYDGLPANLRAMLPFPMLEREDVLLILMPPAMGMSGSCDVRGNVGETRAWADLVAAATAAFGRAPVSSAENRATWAFEDRHAVASIDRGSLKIRFAAGPPPSPSAMPPGALATTPTPPEAPELKPLATAPPAEAAPEAAAPVSAAEEIATAATACVAAVDGGRVNLGEIENAGWTRAGGPGTYARAGGNARIFTTAGQCVVDAYGERMDGFDAIRAAIAGQLRARFGSRVALASAMGREGDFSRGQGFSIGNRIAVLSSERRSDGLSIRFTVMSFR